MGSSPWIHTNPKCRMVSTSKGLVVAFKLAVGDYEIYVAGNMIGRVRKFKHWYPEVPERDSTLGNGGKWPQATRKAAIEWVLKHGSVKP